MMLEGYWYIDFALAIVLGLLVWAAVRWWRDGSAPRGGTSGSYQDHPWDEW